TYCIQVTDSRGGTATTTVTVTINPTLSVSIAPMSVDSGQTATLTAVATGGSGTYALYTWYSGESCSGAPLRSGSSGSYTTAPLVAEAAYCVQVTDSLGGTTTGVVAVTINPALSVSVSPTTIDQGQTASLTADASGGSGSYS